MLKKSWDIDGVPHELHSFVIDGKPLVACFSKPDAPFWEFWCGKRRLALFDHAGDGTLSLCMIDERGRPMKFHALNQHHVHQGFLWLQGATSHVHMQ